MSLSKKLDLNQRPDGWADYAAANAVALIEEREDAIRRLRRQAADLHKRQRALQAVIRALRKTLDTPP